MGGWAGFRTRRSRVVGRFAFLAVREDVVVGDGEELVRYTVVHPGAVAVVPLVGDRTVLMVRQYRAPVGRDVLEIPAGKRDVDGEAPEDTARRELVEEVGQRPGRLVGLAEFYNSPGFCDEYTHLFLGLDLERASSRQELRAEERHMTVERVALDDVDAMVRAGEIVDAKSIIGLVLAQRYLDGAGGGAA